MNSLESVWAAVLHLSIEDATRGPSEQELKDYSACRREDARTWILSSAEGPGTFLWTCELLGLNAAEVREKVLAPPWERLRGKMPCS